MKLVNTCIFILFNLLSAGSNAAGNATTGADPVSAGNLTQITLSLLLVVGLLIFGSFMFKKFGMNKFNSPFPVKVIGAISVGNNQRLVVIEVGEDWIVLGVTPQQISTIATMPRKETPPGSGLGDKINFSTWMQSALEKYHAKKP